jgi:hypothetical protein
MSTINIETGTEGPEHDPYGWREITVTRENGVVVTIHEGLGTWLDIDGRRVSEVHDDLEEIFEKFAGITPQVAERAYEKYTTMCRKCGSREQEAQSGYPGETLWICADCGAMVHYDFNISAVI